MVKFVTCVVVKPCTDEVDRAEITDVDSPTIKSVLSALNAADVSDVALAEDNPLNCVEFMAPTEVDVIAWNCAVLNELT